ncbi:reverse transcriptase domain-containing protein [Trichonephila clavata]|uniref:Reverse transcriptase domain-containing protein n=1 Tax=Trichonephila clavata TaxID=2740835 RepID=A0A8X6KVJ0_TRICU|nr:reverse transcriptase domain-containing protein [Trichonephila clavata]
MTDETDNADRAVDKFTEIILACAISCIPRGKRKKFSPFWNKELQTLKENRDKARNRAESTGMMSDCIELRKQQACLRRAIREAKRQTYRDFVENLDFRRDALRAHQFLSRLNNQKEKRNEPIRIADKLLTSEREIAGAFNKHYANVSNYRPHIKVSKDLLGCPQVCLNQELEDIFNSPFSHWELEWGIKQFPQRKSAGPDGILPEFLAHLGNEAMGVLLQLINLTWASGIPSMWRKGEIIPILKVGKNLADLASFRPITLTCVMCKLTERLIVRRLNYYLEKFFCISDRQAGFRLYRNTTEQVARLTQEIKDGFHLKKSTVAVLVDFQTAFDRVWRKGLLRKLINIGVCGNMYAGLNLF